MGVFWLSFYTIVSPAVGVPQSYSSTGNYADGLLSAAFNADIALYLVVWGFAVFVILVCSIRTNITFIVLFTILDAGLFIFAASHFQAGFGNFGIALTLQRVHFSPQKLVAYIVDWSRMCLHSVASLILSPLHDDVRWDASWDSLAYWQFGPCGSTNEGYATTIGLQAHAFPSRWGESIWSKNQSSYPTLIEGSEEGLKLNISKKWQVTIAS